MNEDQLTTKEQVAKLQADFAEMKAQFELLKSASTIPLDIGRAMSERFTTENTSIPVIVVSTKSATSENKAVDEAGAATYSVMNKPDGFFEVLVAGTLRYIPFFL